MDLGLKSTSGVGDGDIADLGVALVPSRCEEVVKDVVDDGPRDAAAEIRNTNGHIIFGLVDADLYIGKLMQAAFLANLAGSPHSVLEDLEEDVVEMGWDICNLDGVFFIKHLPGIFVFVLEPLEAEVWTVKVFSVADESSCTEGFPHNLHNIALRIDSSQHPSSPITFPLHRLLVQSLIVGYEHVDGDSVEIEPVQDVLDVLLKVVVLPDILHVEHPPHCRRHLWHSVRMPSPLLHKAVKELKMNLRSVGGILKADHLLEALEVLLPDLLVLRLALDLSGDVLKLHDHVGLADGDLLPEELE